MEVLRDVEIRIEAVIDTNKRTTRLNKVCRTIEEAREHLDKVEGEINAL